MDGRGLRPRQRERSVFSGFTKAEIDKMEYLLRKSGEKCLEPCFCKTTARRFTCSSGRAGKPVVKWTEVQNWFQNQLRECSYRASSNASIFMSRTSGGRHSDSGDESTEMLKGKRTPNILEMQFEARSLRDRAWYDVEGFLAHRDNDFGGGEVLVRFSGFGADHDEWVDVKNDVRLRSVPLENSECDDVNAGDMVLCFQVKKHHAMYFDAHVLKIERRPHDLRGCRCQFFIQYDHNKLEEKVPLKQLCRIQRYF